MEQSSSWEAHRFSESREITHVVWNPKVHYHVYKCQPPFPILSQTNPVHALTSHLLKIHHIIILPSMPGSSKWSLSLRFPHLNPVYTSSLPYICYIPCPSHSSRFDHPNNIWWAVHIIKLFAVWLSPLPCYLIPLRPKYSPQHTILKHPQPTLLPRYGQPRFTPIQNNR